ncbi:hypothetical protein L484_000859 [Morus notabilis]|uniref:F-box domain-containing protein n=1 Tax=Morus notabilis TaxID=981085 RepID=W9SM09_9ROSA|nr:F-box protein SKIP28 [Morus notabilis]EXC44993.1 hypothetical protein L484_000859 [Morus notabilis]
MEISQTEAHQITETIDKSASQNTPGPPNEALFLAMAYLPVLELLAMSEVCSSLRDSVKNDILPWLNIVVERPLNKRLCDGNLMQIAAMAKGKLRTLALFNCSHITDDGLQWVVQQNPCINKLLIPGCTGLTPEGVIRAVKTLSQQGHTLKSLWINGVYNVQKHHLETLHSYLQIPASEHRPMSFPSHGNTNFLRLRHHIDLPPIDVQICPRCDEPRMVFDCPRKSCQFKKEGSTGMECRGCSLCIPRCAECGGCFDAFGEIEEAVCGDDLCSNCWLHLPKCSFCNKPYCKRHAEENSRFTSGSTGFVCDACRAKFVESLYYSDDE